MAFAPSNMSLTSPQFSAMGAIPKANTAEADNRSPALSWTAGPEGTQSYAVICHDPDAPLVQNGTYGYVHWVLYNLPAETMSLDEGTQVGTSGVNDGGNLGYGGPMPPEGHGPHCYYFWVLALDQVLDLPEGLTLPEFLTQIEPHLLGMSRLIGTYER